MMSRQINSGLSAEIREKARSYSPAEMPIWEKPLLTVVEAAKYFRIGESNIRRITREFADSDFVYWRDQTRVYIRREQFENYLNSINVV